LREDFYLSFFRVIGNIESLLRKKITLHDKKIDGRQLTFPIVLMSHFDAYQFQSDIIDVKQNLVVDSDTEMYTDLNPKEEIKFMFCYSEKRFATKEMVENEISRIEQMTQNVVSIIQEKMEVLAERQDDIDELYDVIMFVEFERQERRRKLLSFLTFGIFGGKKKEQKPVEEKAPEGMDLNNQERPDEDALDVGGYCKHKAKKEDDSDNLSYREYNKNNEVALDELARENHENNTAPTPSMDSEKRNEDASENKHKE
jgi:hypothetical protein